MKYTNESSLGRRQAAALNKPEKMPGNAPNSEVSGAQRVDPSVRLGDLKGEPAGSVAMETTMGKPRAYQAKKGAP